MTTPTPTDTGTLLLTRMPEAGQTVVAAPLRTFTLPEWLRRAIRTWLQAFLSSLLATLSTVAVTDAPQLADWSWWQKALAAALLSAGLAFLTAVVSALQNGAEDARVLPRLLKEKPGEVASK